MEDFVGVKIALLHNHEVVVIQRDNKPTITHPNMWDLPGGAREPGETPWQCVQREVQEELGITIDESCVLWQKGFPAIDTPGKTGIFMVGEITPEQIKSIVFGDEGQGWKLMKAHAFFDDHTVIDPLKSRLQAYFAARSSGKAD